MDAYGDEKTAARNLRHPKRYTVIRRKVPFDASAPWVMERRCRNERSAEDARRNIGSGYEACILSPGMPDA